MKPCHICERIMRVEKAYHCDKCLKAYCLPCMKQHFQSLFKPLTKIQNTGISQLKLSPCFACKHQCKCLKCTTQSFVVRKQMPGQQIISLLTMKKELVGIDQPIPEAGIFKNTQINELFTFMQRIYLKKKSIYSKHKLLEQPINDMNQDNQNQNNELVPQKQKDNEQQLQGKDRDGQGQKQKMNGEMQNQNQEMAEEEIMMEQDRQVSSSSQKVVEEEIMMEQDRQVSSSSQKVVEEQDINQEMNISELKGSDNNNDEGNENDGSDSDVSDSDGSESESERDRQQSNKASEVKERSKIIEEALQDRKDDSSIQIQVVQ